MIDAPDRQRVVRTYGWQLILGNGPTGILNWLLTTGLTASRPALFGSGRKSAYARFLPDDGVAARIRARPHRLAWRTRPAPGATSWRTFRKITLP